MPAYRETCSVLESVPPELYGYVTYMVVQQEPRVMGPSGDNVWNGKDARYGMHGVK